MMAADELARQPNMSILNFKPLSPSKPKIGLRITATAEVREERTPTINGEAPRDIEKGDMSGEMIIMPRKKHKVARCRLQRILSASSITFHRKPLTFMDKHQIKSS